MSRKICLKMDKISRPLKPQINSFADRLQKVLDEKGLNRHQLAQKLKVSYSRVTDWIEGKGKPSNKNLSLISDKLGINPTWLLTGRGEIYFEKKVESQDILTDDSKEVITGIAIEMVKLGAGVDEARAIFEKLKGIVNRIRERRMPATKQNRQEVVSFHHEDLLTVIIEAMEHLEDDDLIFVHRHIALLLRRRESQRSTHE